MSFSGVVIVNKESGMSSQAVVTRVKRLFGVEKAGHTGTLDPMATGVLPVLVGRAVKASEFMLTEDKHYRAVLLLGITTDTEDITGEVLTRCDAVPTEKEVREAARSFVGEIMQTPPMYSALKVGGKKLYELARSGITVEREARAVKIYSLDCEKINEREYSLDVKCSKGTYIRTLCSDIGKALSVGGTMKALERCEASDFTLDMAHTLAELEAMTEGEREGVIVPVENVFWKLPSVSLSPFFARLAHSGQEIYLKKIGLELEALTRVKLYDSEGFFAVGEVREFEDGLAIKPIRQFK